MRERNPETMSPDAVSEMLTHTVFYLYGKTSEDRSQHEALMIVVCAWASMAAPIGSVPRGRRAA